MVSIKKLKTVLFMLFLLLMSACDSQLERSTNCNIISWNRELFDGKQEAFSFLRENSVSTVYQGIYPDDFENGNVEQLMKKAKTEKVSIFYLIGDPSWNNAETVNTWALKPLVKYNRTVEESLKINTVMLDIEYFNNHSFSENEINDYIEMHQGIYSYAKMHGINIVLCIPFWLRNKIGEDSFLLLLSCCDKLSLTIFSVGNEEKILEMYCDIDKPIEVVLETQKENEQYGVQSCNTYYGCSFEVLKNKKQNLETSFTIENVCYHHLTAMLEKEFN